MKKTAFLSSLCFSLTLVVFAPSQVFLVNEEEVFVSFGELLFFLVPAACALTILFGVMISALHEQLRTKMISLTIAISCLLWVQGSILVWRYGQFDGMPIPWQRYWFFGLADTPLWIIVRSRHLPQKGLFFK